MRRRIDVRGGSGRDQRQGDHDAPEQIADGVGDPVALPHRDERRRRRQGQQRDEHHLGDLANGSVGLPPGFTASSGGYTVTFSGSELYPSPAQLAAGETASRTLTATLGANAGRAGTALTELAANGKTLTLQFTVKASVAPTLGSISTPGGIFHGAVGVVLSVVSMKPLNGSALLDHTWALLSSTFSQLFTSTVYFAPGVGPVEIAAPGAHLSLESSGCAG